MKFASGKMNDRDEIDTIGSVVESDVCLMVRYRTIFSIKFRTAACYIELGQLGIIENF